MERKLILRILSLKKTKFFPFCPGLKISVFSVSISVSIFNFFFFVNFSNGSEAIILQIRVKIFACVWRSIFVPKKNDVKAQKTVKIFSIDNWWSVWSWEILLLNRVKSSIIFQILIQILFLGLTYYPLQ